MFSLYQISSRLCLPRFGSIGSVRTPSFLPLCSVLLRQSDIRPPPEPHPLLNTASPPLHTTRPHSLFLFVSASAHACSHPHSPQEYVSQALARLARIEAVLGELQRPECDSCVEGRLKCDGDGRNPCSWCRAGTRASGEASSLLQQQHAAASGSTCSYSGYSEQARRYGLHRYVPTPPLLFCFFHSVIFYYYRYIFNILTKFNP